jgi:transglutaminase-like putative cysteine protease
MPNFRIHHSTTYRHGRGPTTSWQLLRLKPRDEPNQELIAFDLALSDEPDVAERRDYFGNPVHAFTRHGSANELVITSTCRVRRTSSPILQSDSTPAINRARELTDQAVKSGDFQLEQFRHESLAVPLLPAAAQLAAEIDHEAWPVLRWLEELGRIFSERFVFDPGATTVSTPLSVVLEQRRGVCQDFSHLLISCVRQHGLPAAYVSGYLLTKPPRGSPRLRGADAMHAWVSVWIPGMGWVDYDPTNECFVDTSHIVVARGRDYRDVCPISGVFRGGPRQALTLGVTVEEDD